MDTHDKDADRVVAVDRPKMSRAVAEVAGPLLYSLQQRRDRVDRLINLLTAQDFDKPAHEGDMAVAHAIIAAFPLPPEKPVVDAVGRAPETEE